MRCIPCTQLCMHINCPHLSAGLHRPNSSPVSHGHSRILPAARRSLEDVDYGQEDTDGSPSGSSRMLRQETNFQARAGEHIVKESIWEERKSAVLCIR